MSATRHRHPRATGLRVARDLLAALSPYCERTLVVGSMRRQATDIGDLEILYIPRRVTRPVPGDMFKTYQADLAEDAVAALLSDGTLTKRPLAGDRTAYGECNKLLLHPGTGLPVDLFAATEANWWNLVVSRTGSAANNQRLATRARQLGYIWNVYGRGFTSLDTGDVVAMSSEQQIFAFLGLPYLDPPSR